MRTRTWLVLLTGAALLLIPASVLAQHDEAQPGPEDNAVPSAGSEAGAIPQDPRTLFRHGQRAYEQGDYETAVSDWNRAYTLDARPLIQFNLSQAYERLGRLTDAAAALERYIETADADDQHQADARARRSALRERLGRTGVQIAGAPDGATILIDDRDWGRTPRPDAIRLDPGSHQVVIRLTGYRDFRSSVHVPAGQTVDVSVEMEVDPRGGAEAGSSGGSIWPWIVMGGGGALTLGGVVLGAAAVGKAENAAAYDSEEADQARSMANGADALMVIGLLAVGVGLTWWLLDGTGGGDDVAVTPVAGPGLVGAQAQGRF